MMINRLKKFFAKDEKYMENLFDSSPGFTRRFLNDKHSLEIILEHNNSFFIVDENLVFFNGTLTSNDLVDNYKRKTYFGIHRDGMFIDKYNSIDSHLCNFNEHFPPKPFKTWYCYFMSLIESHNVFVFDKTKFLKTIERQRKDFNRIDPEGC